ncbi:MAG: hypothetical protein ABIW31_00450 [Novosphingobium sp.]
MPTALTLQFAPGHRPVSDDIARLAQRPAETTKFAISHQPNPDEGWLEFIAMGLTFDLSGLAPEVQAPSFAAEHMFGLDVSASDQGFEAVRLVPSPHLAGGRMLLPVLRVLCGLGAELARLPGLRAVGWEASCSWMSSAYFMSAIRAWLVGGAFPSLGLTAFSEVQGGALQSHGLALFTGYEARIEPKPGETSQQLAKLAARAIHQLVQAGPQGLAHLADPAGKALRCEMDNDQQLLHLWREA